MLTHGIGQIGLHRIQKVILTEPDPLNCGGYTAKIQIQFEIPDYIQGDTDNKFQGEFEVVLYFKTMPETWRNETIYEV